MSWKEFERLVLTTLAVILATGVIYLAHLHGRLRGHEEAVWQMKVRDEARGGGPM